MERKRFYSCGATISAITIIALLNQTKKNKRIWVKPWVSRRDSKGVQQTLLKELRAEDMKCYIRYMRIDDQAFDYIVSKVSPLIKRQNTHLRNAISVEDRLMVTLRFLATGESFSSLQFSTRIPQCTISGIIPETCNAIFEGLKNDFLKVPSTQEEWMEIANEYEQKWNVFNTIGAMDGKHIRIQCPISGGAHYYNYKLFNSIILFALVDANYKFIYVDVGTNGRVGDAGVWANSKFRRCLMDPSILNIPLEKRLQNTNVSTPYVILADDAFPLSHNIMKPYPLRDIKYDEKVFNYRLSRGRAMVEGSFGIIASRFRVFRTTINLEPAKVRTVTLACVALHNFLIEKRKNDYTQQNNFLSEDQGQEFINICYSEENVQMEPIEKQYINTGNKRSGKEVRDTLKNFYNGVGKVPWQDKYVF